MNPDPASFAEIRTELDHLAYTPGEALRGTARWRTDATDEARAVLRLIYYTEGKGTRDLTVVDERVFDAPAGIGAIEFEFALPDGPYSFSGKLVSLIWALELDVGAGKNAIVGRLEFILSPTGKEVNLYAHASAEMPKWSGVVMSPWRRR